MRKQEKNVQRSEVDGLVRGSELAELFNVCSETIARWRRDRAMPAIPLPGGQYRYSPRDVGDWLKSTRRKSRGRN